MPELAQGKVIVHQSNIEKLGSCKSIDNVSSTAGQVNSWHLMRVYQRVNYKMKRRWENHGG